MTILKNSQLGLASVGASTNPSLQASQLGLISISGNPAAAKLQVSQLGVIMIVGNNSKIQPLGPPIGLGCWTPCGTLAYNGE